MGEDGDEANELEHAIRADTVSAREVVAASSRSMLSQAIGALTAATAAWSGMDPATAALVAPGAAVAVDTLFAAAERLGAGRKALEATQQIEALRALAGRIDELQARVDELTAKRAAEGKPPPSSGDIAGVLAMYLDAAQSAADEQKRRILTNAVVNAFDPELYEAGLTRTIFATLERLEYGDVHTLRKVAEAAGHAERRPEQQVWAEPGSLRAFHAARLEAEHLIRREMRPSLKWVVSGNLGDEEPPPPRPSPQDTAALTELGSRLLAFAAKPRSRPASRGGKRA